MLSGDSLYFGDVRNARVMRVKKDTLVPTGSWSFDMLRNDDAGIWPMGMAISATSGDIYLGLANAGHGREECSLVKFSPATYNGTASSFTLIDDSIVPANLNFDDSGTLWVAGGGIPPAGGSYYIGMPNDYSWTSIFRYSPTGQRSDDFFNVYNGSFLPATIISIQPVGNEILVFNGLLDTIFRYPISDLMANYALPMNRFLNNTQYRNGLTRLTKPEAVAGSLAMTRNRT